MTRVAEIDVPDEAFQAVEVGLVEIGVDQGRYMTSFDRVRDGFFD